LNSFIETKTLNLLIQKKSIRRNFPPAWRRDHLS